MLANPRISVGVVDAVGATIAGTLLLAFCHQTFLSGDETRVEIARLTGLIHAAQRDARTLRATGRRQRDLVATRQEELLASGELPTEARVEEYFQVLSALSSRHGMEVIRHEPLAARHYPGLLEQRYAYEVSGSLPNLLRLLRSIEQADFWADVSYLEVQSGMSSRAPTSGQPVTVLTISLFSAVVQDVKPDGEDS